MNLTKQKTAQINIIVRTMLINANSSQARYADIKKAEEKANKMIKKILAA